MDQIEEIADEYQSDEQIEEKILEDLKMAIKMELYQRASERIAGDSYFDAGDAFDDGD
jgi:hypothetical protein